MTTPTARPRKGYLAERIIAVAAIVFGLVAIWLLSPGWSGLQLQFAGTYERASVVLAGLSSGEVRNLEIGLLVDFVVIAAYVTLLVGIARSVPAIARDVPRALRGLMSRAGLEERSDRLAVLSSVFVGLAITTGLLDVVEDVSLLYALHFEATSDLPYSLATAAAWPKWILLAFGVTFSLLWTIRRWTRVADRIVTEVSQGAVSEQAQGEPEAVTFKHRVGVCSSGGGIRSAAYNLGAFQALQDEPVWADVDLITAVSGGSYIAGARQIIVTQSDDAAPRKPFAPLSPEERYLRNRTNYLAPGTQGKSTAASRWFRGFVWNVVLLGAVVWVTARPLGWFVGSWLAYPSLREQGGTPELRVSTWISLGVLVVGAMVAASVPLWMRFGNEVRRNTYFRYADYLLYAAGIIFVLLLAIPFALALARSVVDAIGALAALAVASASVIATGVAAIRAIAIPYAGRVGSALAALVVPLILIFGWLFVANRGATLWLGWPLELAVTAVVAAVAAMLASREAAIWSVQPFYMRRLAEAYALAITREADGEEEVRPVPPTQLKPLSKTADSSQPSLVICAAANISSGAVTPPGRNALSFTFAPDRVGMPVERAGIPTQCATADMELALGDRMPEDMTIISAVATSGAAFSPAMGRMTMRSLRMLMAVLNLRLGLWLPNPLWAGNDDLRKDLGVARVFPYFFREMFGTHRLTDKYLYITDGGHWDNLGLVELLRNRCKVIFCFDAGGDKVSTFNTIGEAMSLARSELGIEVDLHPEVMAPQSESKKGEPEISTRDYTIGTIKYPGIDELGHLIFCKAAVTADAPWEVRAYQQRSPVFPNHSTLFQLFDDERFEAYRALGFHTAQTAHRGAVQRGVLPGK